MGSDKISGKRVDDLEGSFGMGEEDRQAKKQKQDEDDKKEKDKKDKKDKKSDHHGDEDEEEDDTPWQERPPYVLEDKDNKKDGKYHGSCHCKDVTFELFADPKDAHFCQYVELLLSAFLGRCANQHATCIVVTIVKNYMELQFIGPALCPKPMFTSLAIPISLCSIVRRTTRMNTNYPSKFLASDVIRTC